MGIPAVVAADRFHPIVAPATPAQRILGGPFQGLLQGPGIGHIHQQTVVAAGMNIARPTIVGRHHRQTTGRSLQQGETERLG